MRHLLLLTVALVAAFPSAAGQEYNPIPHISSDQQARAYYEDGDYAAAGAVLDSLLNTLRDDRSKTPRRYAEVAHDLAHILMVTRSDPGREVALLEEALEIRKNKYGTHSAEYALTLSRLGTANSMAGRHPLALGQLEEASGIYLRIYGPESLQYGTSLTDIANHFARARNYILTDDYFGRAMRVVGPIDGALCEEVDIVGGLATSFVERGQYEAALNLTQHLMDILPDLPPRMIYGAIGITLDHGASLQALGHTDDAIKYLEVATDMALEYFHDKHPYVLDGTNTLGAAYQRAGSLMEAEKLLLYSYGKRNELYGTTDTGADKVLNNLARFYMETGNYPEVERIALEAIAVMEEEGGGNKWHGAHMLYMLGDCYIRTGRYREAFEVIDRAKDFYEDDASSHPALYFSILEEWLDLQYRLGEAPEEIEAMYMAVAEARGEVTGDYSPSYGSTIARLAGYYFSEGRYSEAEPLFRRALEIDRMYPGAEGRRDMLLYNNAAMNLEKLGMTDEALQMMDEYFGLIKERTRRDFLFLSEKERERYVRSYADLCNSILAFASRNADSYPGVRTLAYDCVVFMKSLLLNASGTLNRTIATSGDPMLTEKWERLKEVRARIRSAGSSLFYDNYGSTATGADMLEEEITRLEAEEKQLERELVALSPDYAAGLSNFTVTSGDIASYLTKDGLAIEFVSVDGAYWALVLRHGDPYPEMVFLAQESSLTDKLQPSKDNLRYLFDKLWLPVSGLATDSAKVYYSTSGVLNAVNIHALTDGENYLLDRYDLTRMMSTKDIAGMESYEDKVSTAMLFGGADYGIAYSSLASVADHRDDLVPVLPDGYTLMAELVRGQGFDYLPGSLYEVVQCGEVLSRAGYNAKLFTDNAATEEIFKYYGENYRPGIIHISTHGFYFPATGTDSTVAGEPNIYRQSADPLMRSGLLLSGANNAWGGGGGEPSADGILTALEISVMDLNGVTLAVLPACYSALGDVDPGEGVYGLQRAFAMAGVRNILCAVSRVPDRETVGFVKTFYQHLAAGSTIKHAFDLSLSGMAAQYADDPSKWAGLILLM